MTVREACEILKGTVLCEGSSLDAEVQNACGSDLMSDVLAYVKDQSMLLTGLVNAQVVRTAEMMDMVCVVFVRGKQPDGKIMELAQERGIAIISTPYGMFSACGRLHDRGLRGGGEANVGGN